MFTFTSEKIDETTVENKKKSTEDLNGEIMIKLQGSHPWFWNAE